MLNAQDYEILRLLQIERLLAFMPRLDGLTMDTKEQTLILTTDDSTIGVEVEKQSQMILLFASSIIGVDRLEFWCGGVLAWADEYTIE